MVEVTAQDAQERLHERLQAAHIDPQAMTVTQFWPVFKQFAAIDFGFKQDDGFLVEYFVPNGPASTKPLLNFVRQFTYNDETGLYHHMEQMACTFYFDGPLDDPDISSVVLEWSQPTREESFAQVEALPVFRAALAAIPVSIEWWTGEV